MPESIRLKIVTPEGKHLEKDVSSVIAPGLEGYFQVFPQHIPMITGLRRGFFYYKENGNFSKIQIDKGFVKVTPDEVTAVIDSIKKTKNKS